MKKLAKYLHYYKPYKWILIGVMLGSCLAAILDLLFPILVRQMLDEAIPQGKLDLLLQGAGLLGLVCAQFWLIVRHQLLWTYHEHGHRK